ncbi:MAG: cellulase N-terminal Ig-like domain-containing protein, partial [Candidatus Baldrarchaeota archaeon]
MSTKLLVNQVGYEIDGPKRLLLQSTEKISIEKFYIAIPYSEDAVYEGELEYLGEIKEWGFHYWKGTFTDFKKAGRFIALVEHKGRRLTSPPFQIGHK